MIIVFKRGTTRSGIDKILKKLQRNKSSKGIDAFKYCGIINFPEDPLEFQKRMRNEWE